MPSRLQEFVCSWRIRPRAITMGSPTEKLRQLLRLLRDCAELSRMPVKRAWEFRSTRGHLCWPGWLNTRATCTHCMPMMKAWKMVSRPTEGWRDVTGKSHCPRGEKQWTTVFGRSISWKQDGQQGSFVVSGWTLRRRSLPLRMALWLLNLCEGSRKSFGGTVNCSDVSRIRPGHLSLVDPLGLKREPELPDEPAEAPVPAEKSEAPRRVYIRSSDLEKHGYSALCPACALIRMGLPRQGIAHSEDCRERMVRKLTETEEGRKRVEAAKRKDPPLKFQKVERPEEPQVRDPSAVSAPGPSGGASSSAKRSSEVPSIQEARPAKRVHEVGSKKAKVAVEEPSTVSVPAPPAPSAPSAPAAGDVEMADEGTTRAAQPKRPRESEEEMATNLLLSLRTGFLNAVYQAHEQYPVCEERLGTEQIEEYEASYWDDVSGKPLRPELVEVARKEEIATITEMGVWEVIPRPYNEPVISTRWVDVNKRDEKSPKYRSRLVARELKKRSRNGGADGPYTPSWEDFYASMPPISALRTLFALATTRRAPDLNGRMQEMPLDQCLVFLDIKKAHFWADARRRLLVELPKEAGIDVRKYVGLLRKSLYGTRDAPANWEATILKVMTLLGFVQGRSNSCLYYHSTRGIRVEVHGDDFTGLGAKDQLECFAQELGKHWTVEVRGYLGPPGMAGTKQNIDILNRLVSWTNRGIELEGDPRHAEIIIREMGCSGGKITTPLVKERVEEVDSADPLSSDDASKYRSVSMRLAYLSQDRPDLQVLAKELAKGLKSPTTAHMQMLKRGARYLQNRPRMIHLFPHQRSISRLDIWTDSDHAGCLRTRKSTSGYCVRLGGSTTKTSCKSQAVIALSSGEAEFYSLVSAACGGLGEQSALRDWGIWLPIQCWMDSNTGLAIASRHGLGRVKHVDTIFMWVQDAVSSGRIALGKKPALDMLADLLTKALDQARMRMLLERMNYHFRDGRHSLALDVWKRAWAEWHRTLHTLGQLTRINCPREACCDVGVGRIVSLGFAWHVFHLPQPFCKFS